MWTKACITLSLLTLVFSFQQVNAEIQIAGSGSVIVDKISVTMNVHPQEISIGEEANITIVAKNSDSVERTLYMHAGGYMFDVEVFNEAFSWRWSEGRVFPMIMPQPVVLQPGENYT